MKVDSATLMAEREEHLVVMAAERRELGMARITVKRVQIEHLRTLARERGTSVSALVREAIDKEYGT